MSQDLISMFFDDDFVPHAYLDALFSSSDTKNNTSLTNPKHLQLLQERSSTLLTHLDYYTNELTNDLEEQISKLQASNSVVSYSYESNSNPKSDGQHDNLKPTTRLEYYIDSLSISVQALNDTVSSVSRKIDQFQGDNETTEKLLQLTKARQNLIKVQQSLETIKSIVEIADEGTRPPSPERGKNKRVTAPTSTKANSGASITATPSQLTSALHVLQQTILEQILERKRLERDNELDKELIGKIDDLSALLPVFKNLGEFYNVYSNFVKIIQKEKEGYLSVKNLEDDLFDKVLN